MGWLLLGVCLQGLNTGGRRRMEVDGSLPVDITYTVQVLTLSEAAEVRNLFDSVEYAVPSDTSR